MDIKTLLEKLHQAGLDRPVLAWRAVRPQVIEVSLLGSPGGTVVVRLDEKENEPEEILQDTAHSQVNLTEIPGNLPGSNPTPAKPPRKTPTSRKARSAGGKA